MQKLTNEELREFFAEESIFSAAGVERVGKIATVVRQTVLAKGQQLFSAGQSCDALHFVVRGCGSLVKVSKQGRQRVLHRALPGEIVAAVPFFDGRGYPATFVAERDTCVASVGRADLLRLFVEDPDVGLSILGGVVGRLRMMSRLVEELTFEDTTSRLWRFLLEGSEPSGDAKGDFPRVFEHLPTRECIADLIGSVREVVSRRLSALAASGHVEIEGRRLRLLKPRDDAAG